MDPGVSALWAAAISASVSLIALRATIRTSQRQLESQRAHADNEARQASQRLAEQSRQSHQEAVEQRDFYERQIRDSIALLRNDVVRRRLDEERYSAYRAFADWLFTTLWGVLYREAEWTDDIHRALTDGPPAETLAVLAVLAPEGVLEDFERFHDR